jgi:uncharacterized protein YecE (DUF72 family)
MGTSGLQVPIPKRDFPPAFADKSRLAFYSTLFNSVEINSSFYKIPQAKTLSRWAAETGDDFRLPLNCGRELPMKKSCCLTPQM